jgi:hypothetical protein
MANPSLKAFYFLNIFKKNQSTGLTPVHQTEPTRFKWMAPPDI